MVLILSRSCAAPGSCTLPWFLTWTLSGMRSKIELVEWVLLRCSRAVVRGLAPPSVGGGIALGCRQPSRLMSSTVDLPSCRRGNARAFRLWGRVPVLRRLDRRCGKPSLVLLSASNSCFLVCSFRKSPSSLASWPTLIMDLPAFSNAAGTSRSCHKIYGPGVWGKVTVWSPVQRTSE